MRFINVWSMLLICGWKIFRKMDYSVIEPSNLIFQLCDFFILCRVCFSRGWFLSLLNKTFTNSFKLGKNFFLKSLQVVELFGSDWVKFRLLFCYKAVKESWEAYSINLIYYLKELYESNLMVNSIERYRNIINNQSSMKELISKEFTVSS